MTPEEIIARSVLNTIKTYDKKSTEGYDTKAQVKNIKGKTAWVHIPGGIDETPVELTINANVGDWVQLRVSGGKAWITGNSTAPPTDDTKANEADNKATTATVYAVEAKDVAEFADYKAVVAKETAEAILVYDHSYVIQTIDDELCAVFTAAVYQGGKNIITRFPEDMFTWYLKNEDEITGATDKHYLGTGYQVVVRLSDCGYGSEVISIFTLNDDSEALSSDDSNLTNQDGVNYTVRASGETVRVRDLNVSTNLLDVEKLMVVGVSDEHLITADTLYNYILNRLNSEVIYCGTSTEVVG